MEDFELRDALRDFHKQSNPFVNDDVLKDRRQAEISDSIALEVAFQFCKTKTEREIFGYLCELYKDDTAKRYLFAGKSIYLRFLQAGKFKDNGLAQDSGEYPTDSKGNHISRRRRRATKPMPDPTPEEVKATTEPASQDAESKI